MTIYPPVLMNRGIFFRQSFYIGPKQEKLTGF